MHASDVVRFTVIRTKNTTLSEQFQNRISKSLKEAKSILLTQIHDISLSWLRTLQYKVWTPPKHRG